MNLLRLAPLGVLVLLSMAACRISPAPAPPIGQVGGAPIGLDDCETTTRIRDNDGGAITGFASSQSEGG